MFLIEIDQKIIDDWYFEILKNIYTLSNSHFFNSSISNPSLQSTILLTNLGKRKRVLGQSIKYKDSNKRVVPVGPKLAIPNSYDGFFELLSEDGRSVRCIGKLNLWCKHTWYWGVSSVPFPFLFPFHLHFNLVSSGIVSQSVQNS